MNQTKAISEWMKDRSLDLTQLVERSGLDKKVVEAIVLVWFNVDGTYSAIDNTCTHVGGPLGEGDLVDDIVSCPWHGAAFNVTTGACTGGPAASDVKSFPVKVEGDDVLVELD